ncbi:MAG: type II toxin-antitoxin system prevent-host-death family antitoxin [Solirubrobacterales bacterium]|nr:type II toxin-antitoxin system prevent-host-death family antitoxin [Solirubrobacterales bacterium]
MKVNMLDAKTHLSELVLAAERGEDVVTARAGVPAARLVAVGPGVEPVKLGLLAGQIELGEDFDARSRTSGPTPERVVAARPR